MRALARQVTLPLVFVFASRLTASAVAVLALNACSAPGVAAEESGVTTTHGSSSEASTTQIVPTSGEDSGETGYGTTGWGKLLTGSQSSEDVAIDHEGNIIVSGDTNSSIFVTKLAPDGSVLWFLAPSGAVPYGARMATFDLGEDGSIFFVALYWDIALNGNHYKVEDAARTVVARVSPDGDYIWSQVLDEMIYHEGRNPIRVTPDGDVWVATGDVLFLLKGSDGAVASTINFGDSGTRVDAFDIDSKGNILGASDFSVKKFSPAGEIVWEHPFMGDGVLVAGAIIDDSGDMYVRGTAVSGPLDLDGFPFASEGSFLSKITNDGQTAWVNGGLGESSRGAANFALGEEHVFTVGHIPEEYTENPYHELLLQAFDSNSGDLAWSKKIDANQAETSIDGVAVGADGALAVVGTLKGTLDYGDMVSVSSSSKVGYMVYMGSPLSAPVP